MPSRDQLLFASMLVTPSSLSFEQTRSDKLRFSILAVVAMAVMVGGVVVTVCVG